MKINSFDSFYSTYTFLNKIALQNVCWDIKGEISKIYLINWEINETENCLPLKNFDKWLEIDHSDIDLNLFHSGIPNCPFRAAWKSPSRVTVSPTKTLFLNRMLRVGFCKLSRCQPQKIHMIVSIYAKKRSKIKLKYVEKICYIVAFFAILFSLSG